VKIGMNAMLQVYAFRARQFNAKVTAIFPAADPETQRYTIILDLENPPENLLAGMTGEMNIITGRRENVLLIPTRALLVDQVLVVQSGFVQQRMVRIGYRTLDAAEVIEGLAEGDHVILSDQDKFRPGQPARSRVVAPPAEATRG
jgi:multidrug efflux pump subunit AcrA (membrane-fusion protein)